MEGYQCSRVENLVWVVDQDGTSPGAISRATLEPASTEAVETGFSEAFSTYADTEEGGKKALPSSPELYVSYPISADKEIPTPIRSLY